VGVDCDGHAGSSVETLYLLAGYYRISDRSTNPRRCPDFGDGSGCVGGELTRGVGDGGGPCKPWLTGPYCRLCNVSDTSRWYDGDTSECVACRPSSSTWSDTSSPLLSSPLLSSPHGGLLCPYPPPDRCVVCGSSTSGLRPLLYLLLLVLLLSLLCGAALARGKRRASSSQRSARAAGAMLGLGRRLARAYTTLSLRPKLKQLLGFYQVRLPPSLHPPRACTPPRACHVRVPLVPPPS